MLNYGKSLKNECYMRQDHDYVNVHCASKTVNIRQACTCSRRLSDDSCNRQNFLLVLLPEDKDSGSNSILSLVNRLLYSNVEIIVKSMPMAYYLLNDI